MKIVIFIGVLFACVSCEQKGISDYKELKMQVDSCFMLVCQNADMLQIGRMQVDKDVDLPERMNLHVYCGTKQILFKVTGVETDKQKFLRDMIVYRIKMYEEVIRVSLGVSGSLQYMPTFEYSIDTRDDSFKCLITNNIW